MDYETGLVFSEASTRERRIAQGVACAVIASVLLIAPFGHIPGRTSGAFVAAVYAVYVAATLLTAWLLRDKYRASRFVPLGVLSVGYAYGAAIVALYLLAFPGVFAPAGLIGGLQSAACLWVSAHAGFLCFFLAYSVSERLYGRPGEEAHGPRLVRVLGAVTVAAIAAEALTVTLLHDRLPVLMLDALTFAPVLTHVVAPALLVGYAFTFAVFVFMTGLRAVRNLWLGVVLVALAAEVSAGCILSGARFTHGWYLGCAEGAVAALAFTIVLLRESSRLLAEVARSHRMLEERVVRDGLTDLLNRRGFDDRIEGLLNGNPRQARVALLMIDVDHFKTYNDHFGHLAGDEALRAIAATISGVMHRPQDSCCRIGGDEFAIILPGTDEVGGVTVADRIHRAIAALAIPQAPDTGKPVMSVSIGVGSEPIEECGAEGLHAYSDAALYEAKRLGRDRTVRFTSIGALPTEATLAP
jgi:diguanylate cyclase (GGDEF)-like protein